MNMKEIAQLAGVTAATVSNAINGTGSVSEKKRKEIMEIIEREGYSPNRIAKSLRTKESNTIGIMVEDITAFQTPRIIDGVNNYVEKQGYAVILNNMGLLEKTGNHYSELTSYHSAISKSIKLFNKTQIDGLIYAAMHDRDVMELIPKLNIPIVLVYCYDTSKRNYHITYDNIDIITDVAEYLMKHGHERIGVIKGAEDSLPSQKRLRSFISQLEKAGKELKEEYIFPGAWEVKDGVSAYERYKQLKEKPTAIFAMNDLMAVGFMDAALNDGVRIPEDVSVIGFDNRQECRFTRPRLTTVDIPLEKMGEKAGQILLRLISGQISDEKKVVLPCEFLEEIQLLIMSRRMYYAKENFKNNDVCSNGNGIVGRMWKQQYPEYNKIYRGSPSRDSQSFRNETCDWSRIRFA